MALAVGTEHAGRRSGLMLAMHATIFVLCHYAASGRPTIDATSVKSIGTARKGVSLSPAHETTMFNYTVPSSHGSVAGAPGEAAGQITQMWFTGELEWPAFQETLLRIYVDGEASPSISGPLGMLHGVGFDDLKGGWGSELHGKLGFLGGGIYNSHRVPFSTSISITVETVNQTQSRSFYFMARGLLGQQQVVLPHSFLELPATARLHVFATDVLLQPTEWATLANVSSGPHGVGGLLYMTVQALDSGNAHCLEGIHRAHIDKDPDGPMLLSSGFEDYYLSAQYFDAGHFHTPLTGLTHTSTYLEPKRVSAYRYHTADPIVFSESFQFQWCNGMHTQGSLAAKQTRLRAYVWMYLWPAIAKPAATPTSSLSDGTEVV